MNIGEISVRFRDHESVTVPFSAMLYLASTNSVPLSIGFESRMKHGDVFLSFAKREAYREEKQKLRRARQEACDLRGDISEKFIRVVAQ